MRLSNKIRECNARSLIVDTNPDIIHTAHVSISIRSVQTDGKVTEHLLECKKAVSTIAMSLFHVTVNI